MKGYQRKMVCLKQTGSELFEEAYFVLREEISQKAPAEDALLKEANRIVSAQSWGEKRDPLRRQKLIWGTCGAAIACLLFCIFFWIVR